MFPFFFISVICSFQLPHIFNSCMTTFCFSFPNHFISNNNGGGKSIWFHHKILKILQITWNFSFSTNNIQLTIFHFYFYILLLKLNIYLLLVACTFSSSLQSILNSDTSQAQSLVNSGELAPAETAWDRAPSSNNAPL